VRKRLVIIVTALGIVAIAAVFLSSCNRYDVVYKDRHLKEWATQLRSADPAEREQASSAFKAMGAKAVPGLIHLLKTKDTGLRKMVWSLAGRLPRRARAWFFREFPWPDPNDACIAGARGLGFVGADAGAACPALADALRTRVREVSLEAATALSRIGEASVPALLRALKDEHQEVRHAAVYALGEIGPDAKEAVPALVGMLEEKDEGMRRSVAYSLSRIGPPGLAGLIDSLARGKGPTRDSAAKLLLQYYGALRQAMPALVRMAADESPEMRRQALETLGAIREADVVTVRVATGALKDPDVNVRLAAIGALGQLGGEAQSMVLPLQACLRDESAAVRASAARALVRIGTIAGSAVPALTYLLHDENEDVRNAAKQALGAIQADSVKTPAGSER